MIDLHRECPICSDNMVYRPMKSWTGARYQTTAHEWWCSNGTPDGDGESHTLKFSIKSSEEFKEREKNIE